VNAGGSATGDVTTSGSILSASQSNFGAFVIGSSVMVLPLQFLTVKATRASDYTTVSWKTTNEENVAWHELQKSATPNNFHTIKMMRAGNRREQTYAYNDSSYLNGIAYYRIKSVDHNNQFKYSAIVSVSQKNGQGLNLLTNPAKSEILIAGAKQFGEYGYSLYSMDGRLMQRGRLQAGSTLLSIRIKGGVSPGTYLLTVDGNDHQLAKKVILE
jgi:hypothetical protein